MLITRGIITILAFLLAPIILIRFRKRWVAAFNLAVTNRVTSRFAARLPGFGILTHVGRKSGKLYRTPVNVFRVPEGFLIAVSGFTFPHPPSCMTPRRFPLPVQIVLRLVGANNFMQLSSSRTMQGVAS